MIIGDKADNARLHSKNKTITAKIVPKMLKVYSSRWLFDVLARKYL